MLFFMNDEWEIGLETDASDYGIGGFLFQIDPSDEEKIPIQFVSKSLIGPQLRWSVPEKEMYALYYTVKKLEYILGDVRFTWWTDHKNNTLIRDNGSDKVLRWDLFLQSFDYEKRYIKGEQNMVTDTFSRLCERDNTEFLTLLEELDGPLSTEYLNLMYEPFRTTEEINLLVLPKELSEEIYTKLAKIHNSIVGYPSVERIFAKLNRSDDLWEGACADIISFIGQCA